MSSPPRDADYRSLFRRALSKLDELQAKVDVLGRVKTEPIAIIGLGCRFPMGANDPEAFWRLLRDGVHAISEVPRDRWDVDAYYDPDPSAPGKMYTRYAGFLDRVDTFDPHFFGIAPREAVSMDPQQRLLLEVTWEALEHAGIVPERLLGSLTGVFIGISTSDYALLQAAGHIDTGRIDAYSGTGNASSIASGRLSYTLGLQGPNMAVDTACSSSLVALHLACQSLRNGEAHLALAGGVNAILSPGTTINFSKARMLAADGHCKTFDAAADGYVRGEGCGMVVLKRWSEAIADGDNILALIRGSAINQDGRSNGLTAPNGPAQEDVIRRALAAANVAPHEVDYVEAHGTGTALGDPIEVHALKNVMSRDRTPEHPLYLASVKTNIGHLEAAAGMAGLIKVVLALQHGEIPAHLHFKQLNPHITLENFPLVIPTATQAWARNGKPRIAGLSSFGFSGTNTHIVLQGANEGQGAKKGNEAKEPTDKEQSTKHHLLCLTAKNETSLRALAQRYADHLATHTELALADLCYSALTSRSQFEQRVALIGENVEAMHAQLAAFAKGESTAHVVHSKAQESPKIAFLFTGQGAQYVDMGRELYETQPIFREALNKCDELLRPYLEVPLLSVLYDSPLEGGQGGVGRDVVDARHTPLNPPSRGDSHHSPFEGGVGDDVKSLSFVADAKHTPLTPLKGGMALSNQQPATSNQQPATSNQQPATSNQQPATSNQQPATNNQQRTKDQAPSTKNNLLDQTAYTQPALFALEYALAELWQSWGIKPSVVLGHSVGEYVAACVAGMMSLEDGLKLIAARGRLMQALPGEQGAMAAIFAEEEKVAAALAGYEDRVSIAALNDPNNIVISGEKSAVEEIVRKFEDESVKSKALTVSHAFHSPLMNPMLDAFEQVVSAIEFHAPRIPLISNLTGQPLQLAVSSEQQPATNHDPQSTILDPRTYFRRHLREAVRFSSSIQTLQEQGYNLFLEVGPSPVLLSMGMRSLPEGYGVWMPSLRKGQSDAQHVLKSLGALHVHGATIAWQNFYREHSVRRIALPTYAFAQERYWIEEQRIVASRSKIVDRDSRATIHDPRTTTQNPLLGQRLRSPMLKATVFEAQVGIATVPFLQDHRVYGAAILPATAYVEMALAAAAKRFGKEACVLEDFSIQEALWFEEKETRTLQVVMTENDDGAAFQVFSAAQTHEEEERAWTLHAEGKIRRASHNTATPPLIPPPGGTRAEESNEIIPPLRGARGVSLDSSTLRESSDEKLLRSELLKVTVTDNTPLTPLKGGMSEANSALQSAPAELERANGKAEFLSLATLCARCAEEIPTAAFYAQLRANGLEYGPSFQGITQLFAGEGEALGRVRLPEILQTEAAQYQIHPALLDSCLQVLGASQKRNDAAGAKATAYLPIGFAALHVFAALGAEVWCHVALRNETGNEEVRTAQISLCDDNGRLLAKISELRLKRAPREVLQRAWQQRVQDWFYQMVWQPQALEQRNGEAQTSAGNWMIFADRAGMGEALARLLEARGETCLRVFAGESYRARGEEHFEINPAHAEDFTRMFEAALGANAATLHGLVYLWSLDQQARGDEKAEALEAAAELACGSVLHLVQAAARLQWQEPPRLWLITQGAQSVIKVSALHDDLTPPLIPPQGGTRAGESGQIIPPLREVSSATAASSNADHNSSSTNTSLTGGIGGLAQTPLWGMASSLAAEHPDWRCTCVDLDPYTDQINPKALLAEILANTNDDRIAWRGEERFVARLLRLDDSGSKIVDRGSLIVDREALSTNHESRSTNLQLHITQRGILDNLQWQPATRRVPQAGEVEIAVHATGLNFRDVLNALGMYPGDPGPMGAECSGVIVAIGAGVSAFKVGDEVLALAGACFASFVTTKVEFVAHKPRACSFEQAATIPVTFLTAYYGLHYLAKLKRDERVLIHAAAGGVGIAAVQLAQRTGAEVFATASLGKWEFLQTLGVRHIMNSRTLDFAEEVLRTTNGEGVHVVLNSLAGDFIPKSLGILAPRGRFLEIGKRGIWSDEQVAQTRPDVANFIYDLATLMRDDPALIQNMLREVMAMFAEGALRPLPVKTFSNKEVVSAFRFMAGAKHVGKVVVEQKIDDSRLKIVNGRSLIVDGEAYSTSRSTIHDPRSTIHDPQSTILITGGLGALGLKVAAWLIAKGARYLLLAGRTAPKVEAQALIQKLGQAGAKIVVAQGDVANEAEAAVVLDHIAQHHLPPLKGIIHAAGVLDDGVLLQQSWPRFANVLAPKMKGAWNLHVLTQELPLDFFVLFSSIAAVFNSPGQSNYAAANAFLDGLAHYRQSLGLPALSLNWGPWAEAGMAVENRARRANTGLEAIAPDQGLQAFEEALKKSAAQLIVAPIEWAKFLQQFHGVAMPPLLEVMAQTAPQVAREKTTTAALLQALEAAPPKARYDLLLAELSAMAVKTLGLPGHEALDPQKPLSATGLDSLMAVELRNALNHALGRSLPASLLFDYPTLASLAEFLFKKELKLNGAEQVVVVDKEEEQRAQMIDEIKQLSEAEVEASLAAELEQLLK